jgi:hypothetical protein
MATTAEVKEGTDRAIPEALKESLIRRGYRTMVASLEMRGRVPTMSQWPILTSPAATNLVCGGVRAGKSVVVTDYELGHKRFGKPELIWLGAASYELTKPEFDYIADGMAKMGQLRKASKRVDPGYMAGLAIICSRNGLTDRSGSSPRYTSGARRWKTWSRSSRGAVSGLIGILFGNMRPARDGPVYSRRRTGTGTSTTTTLPWQKCGSA